MFSKNFITEITNMKKILTNITSKIANVEKESQLLRTQVSELSSAQQKSSKRKKYVASNETKVDPFLLNLIGFKFFSRKSRYFETGEGVLTLN